MPVYQFMIFFFSIGGVIILGGASSLYQSTEARRKNAVVPTEAQIVERVIDMSKSTSFVYEFFIDGVRYHAEFFGKFLWRDGKMVSIRYDPDCPEIIYIPSVFRCIKIIASYILGVLWLLVAVMGLVFWWLGVP